MQGTKNVVNKPKSAWDIKTWEENSILKVDCLECHVKPIDIHMVKEEDVWNHARNYNSCLPNEEDSQSKFRNFRDNNVFEKEY